MNKSDLTPELQELLEREATELFLSHSKEDSEFHSYKDGFYLGALSDTAKRIHTEGMYTEEDMRKAFQAGGEFGAELVGSTACHVGLQPESMDYQTFMDSLKELK